MFMRDFLATKLRTGINSLFDCDKYFFIFTMVVMINNNISEEKIYIGRTALRIILSNLISNAVKYSDEYGSINIGSEKGYIYIENTYENRRFKF
ncbi:signal transduction histidine kinase [Moryella indoligenes]|uniref:Signal transduction histidine kinase n=1 Tax=Moryella indoligenes TaxID=371674 RepID=A0AAE3VCL6_9FIRM|nr:signal transduction histidine kinase [Moryella indoligenes]